MITLSRVWIVTTTIKTRYASTQPHRLQFLKMKSSATVQSRNSWINKDEPQDVSSMTPQKDGLYEDILHKRRSASDLSYILKARPDVPQYKYTNTRTPGELKASVMASDRVTYVVELVSAETGSPIEDVKKEAESILNEMAHNLNMTGIRSFAYVLIKVFKALYNRVYVNEEGVQKMRKLIEEYPVLLMPTHRSYLDFLLVSYIFFHYDLPLPAIAAAMDFKGMAFVGWLLRNCGAFYIRRSFGSDKLYWAIFTEYVQSQLRNGDQPLEFFVEGTRSRTAKSLIPKIGMLSASLESYYKAEVPDVMIIPISISYDRIVEESLYAFELLGIPKPKESTSGLLKARGVLDEDYGSVHFHIGEPISIRQFSMGRIDRLFHGLEPRYINSLTDQERNVTTDLAYHVVREHQKHMVISPWAIMAAVLAQSREGIDFKQLVKEVEWLKRQTANLGAYVDWPGNTSSESVIRHYVNLHTNLVSMDSNGFIQLKLIRPTKEQVKKPLKDEVMLNAATNLMLASYRNHLLHVFVRVALVAFSVNSCVNDTMEINELYQRYCFLEKLLCKEFVFRPGETRQDFEQAVLHLTHSGALFIDESRVLIKPSINKAMTFFSQMFEPFLLSYWILCQHLLSLGTDVHGRPLPKKPKGIALDAQQLAIKLLQEGTIRHYEVLSLDILNNGLSSLVSFRTMHKDKRNNEVYLSPNHVEVSKIAGELSHYIEVPPIAISTFTSKEKGAALAAKL